MGDRVQTEIVRNYTAPLRGWPFLSTLGALPILLPIWVFNGILSVEGLPQLWELLIGHPPEWAQNTFSWAGWSTVIFSTLIEIRVIYRTIKGRTIRGSLLSSSLFFGAYDLATTGLGLYLRLLPTSPLSWGIWILGTAVTTFLVEAVLSTIWKESSL